MSTSQPKYEEIEQMSPLSSQKLSEHNAAIKISQRDVYATTNRTSMPLISLKKPMSKKQFLKVIKHNLT